MTGQLTQWYTFSWRVESHIRNYVLPQYGDLANAPEKDYDADDFVKQAMRYLQRFGKQSRQGEELLDMLKAAHWIAKAHERIAKDLGTPVIDKETQSDSYFTLVEQILSPELREIVSNAIGFGWEDGETQSINAMDLRRVVNSVLLLHPRVGIVDHTATATRDAEDVKLIRVAVHGTIRALGGDPDAFVTDSGHTVLDLVLSNVNQQFKLDEANEAPKSTLAELRELPTHYAHRNAGNAIFVKTRDFFWTQNGDSEAWGKEWVPIYNAKNDDDARQIASKQIPLVSK